MAGTALQQFAHVPTIWGETYGFWCQTLVLAAAVIVAVIAIAVTRWTERKKASAAVIFASRRDTELIKSIRRITALHDGDENIASFARKEKIDTDEAKSIRYALNHYEYVSVGISQGIYDENIFKHSSYGTVTKLYARVRPFISELRTRSGSETVYQEFECLACKWKNRPLKRKLPPQT